MSTAKNTITRTINQGSIFESARFVINSSLSLNQGDLVCFDAPNHLIAAPSAEANGITFLGVMTETIVLGKLQKPYSTPVDSSSAIVDVHGPAFGVIAKCILKASVTVYPGDPIYLDPTTGVQGVTNTGTKQIGVYQGPQVTGGPSSALSSIEVYIGHRFPGDTLAF